MLEDIPDLVATLRAKVAPMHAQAYDRVRVAGGGDGAPAPLAIEPLDAIHDIMHIFGAHSGVSASPKQAWWEAFWASSDVLRVLDGIVRDEDAFLDWWRMLMSPKLDEAPEVWTPARALRQWPLRDRARWAQQPCPHCGLRAVKVRPPTHPLAFMWFTCQKCGWSANDQEDEGLWASVFGMHAEIERKVTMTPVQRRPRYEIDLAPALRSGVEHAVESVRSKRSADASAPFAAFLVGATPEIAEQFAQLAERVGQDAKRTYGQGHLLAGGAKLVAEAIRASVADGGGRESEETTLKPRQAKWVNA